MIHFKKVVIRARKNVSILLNTLELFRAFILHAKFSVECLQSMKCLSHKKFSETYYELSQLVLATNYCTAYYT